MVFRQRYGHDRRANDLNKQDNHKPLTRVRKKTEKGLARPTITKKAEEFNKWKYGRGIKGSELT